MTERFEATSSEIACTLTAEDLKDTEAAWGKLLGAALVSRELVPGGVRLEVQKASAPALRQLVDIERECCAWINFDLDGPSLTMTAAGAGADAIREMWGSLPA